MYDIVELNGKLVAELRQIAKDCDIPKHDKLLKKRADLQDIRLSSFKSIKRCFRSRKKKFS